MIKFPSKEKNLFVEQGKLLDEKNRGFIRDALPNNGLKVEATSATIISGPPGVGKTYGTIEECKNRNVTYITIGSGTTNVQMVMKLAYNVSRLKDDEELVLIMDDADDVMFGSYEDLNRWKIALADAQPELGLFPTYNHPVNMTNTLTGLRKQGKDSLADSIEQYIDDDSVGVTIPMTQVRVLVLCNLDLEDPKAFSRSPKMKSAVKAVLDRQGYHRIDADWQQLWGWLAHVLSKTQPFDDHELNIGQKKELLQWMYSNWQQLRSTSFRTVNKLAADMINFPDDYESKWETKLRGN
jgi:hypothetical protein